MRKIITIISIVILAACNQQPTGNKTLTELRIKRDSLQNQKFNIEKELNKIDTEIAVLDSSINPNDIKIVKQIATQRNRIVAVEAKIRKLENKMTARGHKTLIPVAVKNIQPELFNHYIITYGEVEAKNYAKISSEMNGRIQQIHVSEGVFVKKGDLLVSLNTDAIEKQITGVKSNLELATKTFNKLDILWKENIGSEIEYLSAKSKKEALESQLATLYAQKRMSQIVAPFSGIVDQIYLKKGEIASPGYPVIEFVNLNKLVIKADVSETHIEKIRKGQLVELSFSSLPNYKIKTPIIRMSKVINSASRTFEIEMEIDNPDEKINPNIVSTIKINDFSSNKAFVIPSLSIRKDISGNYVYIVNNKNDKNIVAKKYIKTGLSFDENTLVLDGLDLNDMVIVKGYHLVSSGVEVNLVENKK
ncbi:MAG: efflux RND transporter periplasmic adaptor subunit [Bacteroidales bacterium]|nr:efflux RND transporter periplasmic adaptor subunit [Bacteroidales bacterium]